MPDHTTASTADAASNGAVASTIDAYVATWNETDAGRRQAGIARAWVPDARYRDPVMASDGHAGIDAMLAAVQAKSRASCCGGRRRSMPTTAPAGSPGRSAPPPAPRSSRASTSASSRPTGRLVEVVGFIDKAPG